jgi:hypothetical protein
VPHNQRRMCVSANTLRLSLDMYSLFLALLFRESISQFSDWLLAIGQGCSSQKRGIFFSGTSLKYARGLSAASYRLNPSQRYREQSRWTKFRTSPAGQTVCPLFLTETPKKFKGAGLKKLVQRWKSMWNMTTIPCICCLAAHVFYRER